MSYSNQLVNEKSPYLLQHASNPVDWLPWSNKAFDLAKAEDKPIFLSIGYSTCHWCHVMEHESFQNITIANLLNKAFVCVKVDREERPDIDSIYMTVCQMMNGSGGWPLSIFLLPNQKAFHAATYIPPEQRYGRIGLRELIPRISDIWIKERHILEESAEKITNHLLDYQHLDVENNFKINASIINKTQSALLKEYDNKFGGFGKAPKFPLAHKLLFLLKSNNPDAINASLHTLEKMRLGGIYDQIGYGFHRYSTDQQWLVPHFEKMLYDQALMIHPYLEAYIHSSDKFYKNVVDEIIEYVLRDLSHPEGCFYTAEDADSEGEEGIFYLWKYNEIEEIFGDSSNFIISTFNIKKRGNYKDEASGLYNGKNIPYLTKRLSLDESKEFDKIKSRLLCNRTNREHPSKDKKILTDWNSLMIAALARAGHILNKHKYIDVAKKADQFLQTNLMNEGNDLFHRWMDNECRIPGYLEDYVFYINGLIELYYATLNAEYISRALDLADKVEVLFKDRNQGYFMTSEFEETLISRPKEIFDGAVPSGNSIHFQNLLRLFNITSNIKWQTAADNLKNIYESAFKNSPSNIIQALLSINETLDEAIKIIILGDDHVIIPQCLKWLKAQNINTIICINKDNRELWGRISPFTKEMNYEKDQISIYVCKSFKCNEPVHDLESMKNLLIQ